MVFLYFLLYQKSGKNQFSDADRQQTDFTFLFYTLKNI